MDVLWSDTPAPPEQGYGSLLDGHLIDLNGSETKHSSDHDHSDDDIFGTVSITSVGIRRCFESLFCLQTDALNLSDDLRIDSGTLNGPLPFGQSKSCGPLSENHFFIETMFNVNASSVIQCITPISQRIAEKNMSLFCRRRRRSVAVVDEHDHKQFGCEVGRPMAKITHNPG